MLTLTLQLQLTRRNKLRIGRLSNTQITPTHSLAKWMERHIIFVVIRSIQLIAEMLIPSTPLHTLIQTNQTLNGIYKK